MLNRLFRPCPGQRRRLQSRRKERKNHMSRIVFLEERCNGCRLCVEACPAHILRPSGRFNHQGYEVMEMDGQCTGCASCAVMCPDTAIRVFRSVKIRNTAGEGAA